MKYSITKAEIENLTNKYGGYLSWGNPYEGTPYPVILIFADYIPELEEYDKMYGNWYLNWSDNGPQIMILQKDDGYQIYLPRKWAENASKFPNTLDSYGE